jgi:hypothetical protein
MRPRFSIRTLLVVTALFGGVCYWWVVRPTIVANRFVLAMKNGDYVDADLMRSGINNLDIASVMMSNPQKHGWQLEIALLPRTMQDVWYGIRRIDVHFVRGSTTHYSFPPIIATSAGVAFDRTSLISISLPEH